MARSLPVSPLNELSLYLKLHLGEYLPGSPRQVIVLYGRGPFHAEGGPPPGGIDEPPGQWAPARTAARRAGAA